VERLWRSLTYEEVYPKAYETVAETLQRTVDYFRFYNREPRHQCLNRQIPDQIYEGRVTRPFAAWSDRRIQRQNALKWVSKHRGLFLGRVDQGARGGISLKDIDVKATRDATVREPRAGTYDVDPRPEDRAAEVTLQSIADLKGELPDGQEFGSGRYPGHSYQCR